jgi:hypothetical protein
MAEAFPETGICPIFIGRQLNLTALCAIIDNLKSAQGQVVRLSGEAGIGRSRLVAETKHYAADRDSAIFQGNCFSTDRALPYAPLLDLLRSYFFKQAALPLAEHAKPLLSGLSRPLPDLVLLFPHLANAPLRHIDPFLPLTSGTEFDLGPADVAMTAPGHDAWVIGDEPGVGLDFQPASKIG